MNMEDIFSQFGDIFGGAFGGGAGGGGGRRRRMKGSNLRIKVKLTLEEIASGVEKKVKVFKQVQAEGAEYGIARPAEALGESAASRTPSSARCKRPAPVPMPRQWAIGEEAPLRLG